jgi:menaquinol-cytochrome c reductase cytochrome b/c subunit
VRPVAAALAVTAALAVPTALAGCGDGGGSPTSIDVETENPRGREVAASSGCLGCHSLGDAGNRGPGPDLTKVGVRLPRERIAEVLVDPPEPMPSYARLKEQKPQDFEALVDFLAGLR